MGARRGLGRGVLREGLGLEGAGLCGWQFAEGMGEGTRPQRVLGDALRGQAGVGRRGAVHGDRWTPRDRQGLARWPGRVGPEQRDHGGLGTPPHPLWLRLPRRLPGPLWSPPLRCCPRRRSPDVPAPAALRPARPARRDPGPGRCSTRSPPSRPRVSISSGGHAERWASRHPHPCAPRGYLHPRGRGWVPGSVLNDSQVLPQPQKGRTGDGSGMHGPGQISDGQWGDGELGSHTFID